jgi:hypothetical protein
MGGPKFLALLAAAGACASAVIAAQLPPPLAQVPPGQWEISGAPGLKLPVRQCVADVVKLAEFEHRGKSCSTKIISSSSTSAVIEYSCGAAGFGRSQIDVITPRSFRIQTQGISEQLPFSYLLQARRIGDCPGQAAAPRH